MIHEDIDLRNHTVVYTAKDGSLCIHTPLGKKKLTSADIDEAHDEALSMVKELGLKHIKANDIDKSMDKLQELADKLGDLAESDLSASESIEDRAFKDGRATAADAISEYMQEVLDFSQVMTPKCLNGMVYSCWYGIDYIYSQQDIELYTHAVSVNPKMADEKAGQMLGFKESCDTAKELINEILEIE